MHLGGMFCDPVLHSSHWLSSFTTFCQVISGFYSDTSMLVWNGHTKTGVADISAFYQSLPSTEHMVISFDCQPVAGMLLHPSCFTSEL